MIILQPVSSSESSSQKSRTLQGTFLPSMVPIHPMVLEKKFVLHISHRVTMLTYVPSGGHPGFSIGTKSNNTWLAACNDHS